MIATCFALVSFAAAILVGYYAGNSTEVILWRAIGTLVICWFIGRAVGAVAVRVLETDIAEYKRKFPIPVDDAPASSPKTADAAPERAAEAAAPQPEG